MAAAGATVWVWDDVQGWRLAWLVSTASGGRAIVRTADGLHAKLFLEDDCCLTMAEAEPQQLPRSVVVSGRACGIGELRNNFVRGLIKPPASLVEDVTGRPRCALGVDTELRTTGLWALRDILEGAVITTWAGIVRTADAYARVRRYAGPPVSHWNSGQFAAVVPGSRGPLCVDAWTHVLGVKAALASGDDYRLRDIARDGLGASVTVASSTGEQPNAVWRWTPDGELVLVARGRAAAARSAAAAVETGHRVLAEYLMTVA